MPSWDSKANLSMKKGSSSVPLPTGPEQLRKRLTIMQNALLMIKLKYPHREEFKDLDKNLFDQYKDFILGDYVYGLSPKDASGNTIGMPPWQLVLSYEQSVRKMARRQMAVEQVSWGKALREAWKDATNKERRFTTPLALYAKRPFSDRLFL